MTKSEVALLGAPDTSDATHHTNASTQAMQISLTNDMLEELLECARSGKPPQILFGSNPTLRCGTNNLPLTSTPERHRRELYAVDAKKQDAWTYAGSINHSLSVTSVKERTDSVDHALEVLKSRVAAEKQEREVNKTVAVLAEKKKQPLNNRRNKLDLSAKPAHSTSSPSLNPTKSSYLTPPKSAALDSSAFTDPNFLRKPILYRLALGPQSFEEAFSSIVPKSHQSQFTHAKGVFKAVATESDGVWKLNDKMYKEVQPYDFAYSEEQREKVVNHAIRAFDRIRIPKADSLWQQLLPAERRGKGECLSRLNLNPTVEAVQSRTPVMTPKRTFDKKTGLPKKTETKKPRKTEENEKVSPEKKGADSRMAAAAGVDVPKSAATESLKLSGPKDSPQTKPKAKPAPLPPKVTKPIDRPSSTASLSRPATPNVALPPKPPAPISASKSASAARTREAKPSTASKSLLNKPKNPSPLSRSPPVNASDLGTDHPVHKKLSAAVSPARPLKRKAEDERESSSVKRSAVVDAADKPVNNSARKVPHPIEDRKPAEKPTVSTPISGPLKRKAAAVDHDSDLSRHSTPVKIRKVLVPSQSKHSAYPDSVTNHARADRTPPSTSSDLDDESINGDGTNRSRLTWRQALDAAVRFEQYYPRYKKLHHDLCNRKEKPSAKEYDDFMRMHRKIGEMKRQIREASWRGGAEGRS